MQQEMGKDVLLASISGGTDVCSAFVASCPLLPVHAGEIQCRCLGADVDVLNSKGIPVTDTAGELVIKKPMPSMPRYFWNDPEYDRYEESYFRTYPGIWRHGDWAKVTPRGSCVILGRSDSTLNRGGVRMGTGEVYSVVEEMSEIEDSLIIDTGDLEEESAVLLFLVLANGVNLDETLRAKIVSVVRTHLSPRHVPDEILAVPEIPRTPNGKKLEIPVRRILKGVPTDKAVDVGAMANPSSVDAFVELAKVRRR